MVRLKLTVAGLFATLFCASAWLAPSVEAQQVRDTFNKVKSSVVVVRTVKKTVAPFPQEGSVLEYGLGSGVLISDDGKVLTAAHVVQSADHILVEFPDGKPIPARVTNSAVPADCRALAA